MKQDRKTEYGLLQVAICSRCNVQGFILTNEGMEKFKANGEFKHVDESICIQGVSVIKPRGGRKRIIL